MIVIGIDENGLGPLLGPLVVTASAFEVSSYDREAFFKTASKILPADDSKKIFGKNRMAKAEKKTLSWLGVFGVGPCAGHSNVFTYSDMMKEISGKQPFTNPCGSNMPNYCRPSLTKLPLFSTASSDNALESLELFGKNGIRPVSLKSISLCPGTFNLATADPSTNKFNLDFRLMMHLAAEIREDCLTDVEVYCGKVGSTRRYGEWFEKAGFNVCRQESETAELSTYWITGLGKVSFARDGDASHLPIAVASMIGKYVRELAMKDLNALLGAQGAKHASGYRDKVTACFVRETEKRRSEIGLVETCFLRSC